MTINFVPSGIFVRGGCAQKVWQPRSHDVQNTNLFCSIHCHERRFICFPINQSASLSYLMILKIALKTTFAFIALPVVGSCEFGGCVR